VIPAGSRKTALVHLALEAWRVDLLQPKVLGEVRGREMDEDGLQRALYRSTVAELEHVLGPILKGRKVVVKGRLEGTGRSTLERLGAEVQELRLEDEKHYVDMTPVVFVFAAIAMAVRYISLGLDDQSLYILAGISFALMYGLRPFFSKLQRPKD
jgi:cytochrome c-type biogenesis protein CcmH/NrfG